MIFSVYVVFLHNMHLKIFAQKIKIEVKMCAHDEVVFWESFLKGKLANKL